MNYESIPINAWVIIAGIAVAIVLYVVYASKNSNNNTTNERDPDDLYP